MPKCHPEIAGRGVEYTWGYAKLQFRRGINDAVASHLEENVKTALSREVLTINRIRKFARKAQDYKLTYLSYLVAFLPDGEELHLQLRATLSTSQSCLSSIVQSSMPIISSLLMHILVEIVVVVVVVCFCFLIWPASR